MAYPDNEPNWNSLIDSTAGEVIHFIQIPETQASDVFIRYAPQVNYLFRCKAQHAKRAVEIAKSFALTKLYWENNLDGTAGKEKVIEHLPFLPTNFSATCSDNNLGRLWDVTYDLVPYGELMNDPDFQDYLNIVCNANTEETMTDLSGMPLLLQYKYPANHPRRPDEIITTQATAQRDVAVLTFQKNLIKEMKYPEAAAGWINHVNSLAWNGWAPRQVKITNVTVRPRGTNPSRTDYTKHIYTITFEMSVHENGWDSQVAITDPETGQHPGDVSYNGSIQPGCTKPAGYIVYTNPAADFNRLWPTTDSTNITARMAHEFPVS